MPFQIVGVLAGAIGYFAELQWLLLVGGALCILVDVMGFASGKLNPLFPAFLYIVGYVVAGSWLGILYGSIIGNSIEVAPLLLAGALAKLKDRSEQNS